MTSPTEVKIVDSGWFLMAFLVLVIGIGFIIDRIDRNTAAIQDQTSTLNTFVNAVVITKSINTPDTYCQTHDCAVSKVPFEPLGKKVGADRDFTVSKMCPDNIFTAQETSADGKMVVDFKCE